MDEALTADEHAQVERWLQSEPSIAAQLKEMCQIRSSLREIATQRDQPKLDDGFADRVLEAAVARARGQGLADDHPLVRVSEQPATHHWAAARSMGGNPAFRRSVPWLRIAGVCAGVAASLAIAVAAWGPSNDPVAKKMAVAPHPFTIQMPRTRVLRPIQRMRSLPGLPHRLIGQRIPTSSHHFRLQARNHPSHLPPVHLLLTRENLPVIRLRNLN